MQIDLGNNCQIRSFRPDDAPALAQYTNNRKVWLNLRDAFPHPYKLEHAAAWIRMAGRQYPEVSFAIASAAASTASSASTDEVIGGIGLGLQTDVNYRSSEIGYWLGEPFWGRGIATAALSALTDYAFAHYDLIRLFAYVFEWNPASMRVLEKAGYTYEGRLRKSATKDGKIVDQILYAKVLE